MISCAPAGRASSTAVVKLKVLSPARARPVRSLIAVETSIVNRAPAESGSAGSNDGPVPARLSERDAGTGALLWSRKTTPSAPKLALVIGSLNVTVIGVTGRTSIAFAGGSVEATRGGVGPR